MLVLENVSYSFHAYRELFSCVNMQVQAGDIVHIAGSNGSGKTTLFKGLVGLLDLRGDGISLFSQTDLREFRRQCWYLPAEHHGLFGHLSAWGNLMFYGKLHARSSHGEILQHLQNFGFTQTYLRSLLKVKHFSTGMKRRLALCKMACFYRPLWLLDEPSYGLDEQGLGMLKDLLKAHQENGGMAVVASHDVSIFSELCVKRMCMEDYKVG